MWRVHGDPGDLFFFVRDHVMQCGVGGQRVRVLHLLAPLAEYLDAVPRNRRASGDPVAHATIAAVKDFGNLRDTQSVGERQELVECAVA